MADDAFVHGEKLVVKLVMFPIALGYTPAGLGIFFQQLEAGFLFFLGQVQPEFNNLCAFIGQHLFQTLCALQTLVEFGDLGYAMHPVEYGPRIP